MTVFKKLTVLIFLDQEMLADHRVTVDSQADSQADRQVDQNHLDQDQSMDRLKDLQKLFQNGFVERLEKTIENKNQHVICICTQ